MHLFWILFSFGHVVETLFLLLLFWFFTKTHFFMFLLKNHFSFVMCLVTLFDTWPTLSPSLRAVSMTTHLQLDCHTILQKSNWVSLENGPVNREGHWILYTMLYIITSYFFCKRKKGTTEDAHKIRPLKNQWQHFVFMF